MACCLQSACGIRCLASASVYSSQNHTWPLFLMNSLFPLQCWASWPWSHGYRTWRALMHKECWGKKEVDWCCLLLLFVVGVVSCCWCCLLLVVFVVWFWLFLLFVVYFGCFCLGVSFRGLASFYAFVFNFSFEEEASDPASLILCNWFFWPGLSSHLPFFPAVLCFCGSLAMLKLSNLWWRLTQVCFPRFVKFWAQHFFSNNVSVFSYLSTPIWMYKPC